MDKVILIDNIKLQLCKKDEWFKSIQIIYDDTNPKYNQLIDAVNKEIDSILSIKNICQGYQQSTKDTLHIHTIEEIKNKYDNELLLLRKTFKEKEEMFEKNKQFYEDEMNLLKIKFSQSISNLNSSIELRVTQETKHMEEKFKIKEDFYKQTIQELKDTQNALDAIQTHNSTIMNILQKPKASAEIGIEGEQSIYRILRSFTQYNIHAKIENVSSNSMTGDIRFVYDSMACCIEVKNIKEDIGQGHFDKFYRDLHKSTNQYNCGIFISIQSGFTIKSHIEDMEVRIYDNKPIIYLAHTQKNEDKIIIAIHMLNRLVKLIQSGYSVETHQYIEQFKTQIEQLSAVQNQLKTIKQSVKIVEDIVSQSKKNICEMLTKEDIPATDTPSQCKQISTPCGKIYKGVTKNYKNHIQTCLPCKHYMSHSTHL